MSEDQNQTAADETPETPEDFESWLKTVPGVFHPVARRHGKLAFDFAMACGMSGAAIQDLHGAIQQAANEMIDAGGQMQAQALVVRSSKALGVIAQFLEGFAQKAREAQGFTPQQIREIQEDIERLSALAGPQATNGIILPH